MISKLHYITQHIASTGHAELAGQACLGGVKWVQLRVKNIGADEWLKIANETKAVCLKHGATLIINDNVKLALEIGADGVHLGKEDMKITEARNLVGNKMIIGATANTFEDIVRHAKAGADYIGLGPFRFTSTKENLSPILGIDGYRRIVKKMKEGKINIPLIAIGGITLQDVSLLMNAGVSGIAVSSAINLSADREGAARAFVEGLNKIPLRENT